MIHVKVCPHCAKPLVSCLISELERYVCASCQFIHSSNHPIPAVAGLVEYEGGVLLVRPTQAIDESLSLVTGYLKSEETPEQGIVREIREILGLEASIRGLIGHYSCFSMNTLILAFHLEAEGCLRLHHGIAEVHKIQQHRLHQHRLAQASFAHDIIRDWSQQRIWRQVA